MRKVAPRASLPRTISLYDSELYNPPIKFSNIHSLNEPTIRSLPKSIPSSYSLYGSQLFDLPVASSSIPSLSARPPPLPSNSSSSAQIHTHRFALTTRKPRKGDSIAPSSFRPSVLAKDRIHAWTSPYLIAKRIHNTSLYPSDVLDLADKAMSEALVDTTKSSYAAGPLRYTQFCDIFNITEELRMPASEELIAGFIGHNLGKVSGDCVKGWLSGLRAWHDLNGAPWPSESRMIRFA